MFLLKERQAFFIMWNPFRKKELSFSIVPFWGRKIDPVRITQPETFFDRSVYFNKALDKRASVVGSADFIPYRGEKIDEQLHKLLQRPNNFLSGDDFWYLAQLYYDLYGAFYIWKENGSRIPRGLHLLDPNDIEVVFEDGEVVAFRSKETKQEYDTGEIIWEHRPDPKDPKESVSILNEGGKDTLRTEIELRDYQKKIARNKGRISGVFSFDTEHGLSPEQLRKLKEGYKLQRDEARDEGEMPMFLGGKANFHEMTRSPRELESLQVRYAILEEVGAITGVPAPILSSFSDIKYSNAQEARRTFLEETIKPILKRREATLNHYLAPDGVTIEAEDITPEELDDLIKRLQAGDKVLTLNEIREELGYEPIDNGDTIYRPMADRPIEDETSPNKPKE